MKLSITAAIVSTLAASAAFAAPVAPSGVNLRNAWLFDTTVGTQGVAGYATPAFYGSIPLVGNKTVTTPNVNAPIHLVEPGDSITLNGGSTTTDFSATKHSYAGNHSLHNDWWNGTTGQTQYPNDRTSVGAYGLNYNIGATGSVSFLYNPIYHVHNSNPSIAGDSYLFMFRNNTNGNGARLYGQIDHPGDTSAPANGRITVREPGGSDQNIATNWGINYNNLANGQPSNTWYNVAVTWDASGVKAYVDGTLVSVANNIDFSDFGIDSITIGQYSNWGTQAPGLYDEFGIWDTALTDANIEWLQSNSLANVVVPEPASLSAIALAAGLLRRRR